jgi:hypothetical protein
MGRVRAVRNCEITAPGNARLMESLPPSRGAERIFQLESWIGQHIRIYISGCGSTARSGGGECGCGNLGYRAYTAGCGVHSLQLCAAAVWVHSASRSCGPLGAASNRRIRKTAVWSVRGRQGAILPATRPDLSAGQDGGSAVLLAGFGLVDEGGDVLVELF